MDELAGTEISRLTGLKVLIVEDEPALSIELVDELRELGAIPIGPMPSLVEALAAVDEHAPDAVVLDVQLQDQMSVPVAKLLVERNIPFIFVTGNDAFVRGQFPDVPAYPKPCDMAAIVDALELLLRSRPA